MQVAPGTYYAAKDRARSARAISDGVLIPELVGTWEDNYRVFGARKLWKAARRAGIEIGRDQTGRLMRAVGIEGAIRSKRVKTTRPDPTSARHPDLVKREFTAVAPNRLWVTDLTFVPTWAGVAYVCFVIDAFSRMIVGWRCASHMRTEMVLDAIEMTRWSRGRHHEDLRCHKSVDVPRSARQIKKALSGNYESLEAYERRSRQRRDEMKAPAALGYDSKEAANA